MKNKLFLSFVALAALMLLNINGLKGQHLVNSGTLNNTGQIIFSSASATFENNTAVSNITNTGTFTIESSSTFQLEGTNPVGVDVANRFPGLVSYASDAVTAQPVTSAFYTDLDMSSTAEKNLGTQIWVFEDYSNNSTGNLTYTSGTFYYNGTSSQTVTATTNGDYETLVLEGTGAKNVLSGQTVNVTGALQLESDNTGGLTVNGLMDIDGTIAVDAASSITASGTSGTFRTGAGEGVYDGNVTVDTDGTFDIAGTGSQTFTGTTTLTDGDFMIQTGGTATTSGAFNLADNADAVFTLASGSTFTVDGTYTNNHAAGVNVAFNDASDFVYAQGTAVEFTVESNPYGNLWLIGADKTTDSDVYISGNYNQDLTTNGSVTFTSGALIMIDNLATASYDDGEEIYGSMTRYTNGGSNTMTFNNNATRLVVTDTPEDVQDFTLDVRAGNENDGTYDASRDVLRTVDISYSQTGTDFVYGLTTGWLPAEDPTGSSLAFRESIRYREVTSPGSSEKVSTGVLRDYNDTDAEDASFRSLTLAGLRPTGSGAINTLSEVATGAEVFLRGGPTEYISVTPGRWSNPATWDEGTQPGPEDIARIRHTVHVGYVRTNDNYTGDEQAYINSTSTYTNSTDLIAKIIIEDQPLDANADVATLMFGGNTTYRTNSGDTNPGILDLIPDAGNFVADNIGGSAVVPTLTSDEATNANFNAGLVVFPGSTLVIRGNYLNSGQLNNAGVIRIGEEE